MQESYLIEVVRLSLSIRCKNEALSFLDLGSGGRKSFLNRGKINRSLLQARIIFNFKPIVGLMFTKILETQMFIIFSHLFIVTFDIFVPTLLF